MLPNMRVLTVLDLGETPEQNASVTLSALNIKMVAAMDGEVQGRPAKLVSVFFLGEDQPVGLTLTDFDLLQIQQVVGSYGFYEE